MTLYTVATGNVIQAQDVDQVVNWLQHSVTNAYDYGALPANTAAQNDTALAAAISAIGSRGTLLIPPGVYAHTGISLASKTDINIMGTGPGAILAPTTGNTAITLTDCVRCNVSNLKIDGSVNGGATGISVSGDFDAHIYNLHINGLSGDAIYVQGDSATGLETHFNNVTARANGGYGYHHVRTTTTDHGGVYLTNYQCIYDTQGAGGVLIDASGAGSSVGTFHFGVNVVVDNYVGGPSLRIRNAHHNRFVNSWFAGTNSGGASVLLDGDGYMNGIDQAYVYNGGTAAGSYNISIADTQHDNMFNLIEFDGAPIAHVHVGPSSANNILGFYNIFGSSALTDTVSALWSRGATVQQFGPMTVQTPGSWTSSSFGIADPANVGTEKWLRNSNGSFEILNTAFSSTIFRVDDGGFVLAGGGIMPFGNNAGACTLYSGSGAPGTGLGGIGDYYFRSDTPSTANQRLYAKTGASTWTGIV